MQDLKVINGLEIYKCGTWSEVVNRQTGEDVYCGSVDESMTHLDIYNALSPERHEKTLLMSLTNVTFSEIEEELEENELLNDVFNHGEDIGACGGSKKDLSFFYNIYHEGVTYSVEEDIEKIEGKQIYKLFNVYRLK